MRVLPKTAFLHDGGLAQEKPKEVPIVINLGGFADVAETWVDGAKWFEELGADMIEVNLGCPLPSGVDGTLQGYQNKKYSPLCQGLLMGDNPETVYNITKAVADAVSIPVGVKLTPETGFPRIIDVTRAAYSAGAQFVQLFNAAVGMAPPDIYNGGKPKWLYMDGSPFCMASGSFLRIPCYKSVAAVKRYVPDLDIAAAGGLVEPEHFIEAMMLGASLVQPCTGIIEQGNSLIRKGINFMKKFVVEQGYDSLDQIVGLGQKHIKYNQDIDMMAGKTRIYIDHDKCVKCLRCVDNICQALSFEEEKVQVDLERCVGCGGCVLACRHGALEVGLREVWQNRNSESNGLTACPKDRQSSLIVSEVICMNEILFLYSPLLSPFLLVPNGKSMSVSLRLPLRILPRCYGISTISICLRFGLRNCL